MILCGGMVEVRVEVRVRPKVNCVQGERLWVEFESKLQDSGFKRIT